MLRKEHRLEEKKEIKIFFNFKISSKYEGRNKREKNLPGWRKKREMREKARERKREHVRAAARNQNSVIRITNTRWD